MAWAEEDLAKTLERIQEAVMRLRLVPLHTLLQHLHRLVYDESRREGKQVRFEVTGGDTTLDKALIEMASEALGHLVRNAVIHGIEPPDERAAAGKPRQGRVRLTASTSPSEVLIEVEDDGRGIDRRAITESARRRGLEVAADETLATLLFRPGISTRRDADLSAGRGIGLSAVKESAERHGGRVEVSSRPGQGSQFRLRLPLSVSITRALLLRADGEDYAVPLSAVIESLQLAPGDGHQLNQAEVFRWRRQLLSLLDLGLAFGTAERPREGGFVVIIESGGRHRGLVVDRLLGIREIVVKGLDPVVGSPQGILGSTILGDGRAILILDPAGIMARSPFLEARA